MKTLRTLLTGVLAASALFASCSKEEMTTDPMANQMVSPSASAKKANTDLFKLSQVQFYGYIRMTSDKGKLFDREAPKYYDMSMAARDMGSAVLVGKHRGFEAVYHAPASGAPYVTLTGLYYNSAGNGRPVVVEINRGFTMHVSEQMMDVTPATTLGDIMGLSMTNVTKGITASDWDAAVVTNGRIVISRDRNTNMYNRIIGNLVPSGAYLWH